MDLPVGLAGDVDVVKVTSVIFGVSSSQQQLTTRVGCWVPETDRRKTCCCSCQTSESTFEDDKVFFYPQYQKLFPQQILWLYMTFDNAVCKTSTTTTQ